MKGTHELADSIGDVVGDLRKPVPHARIEVQLGARKLRAPDRAFLGYLGGVALREAGLVDDARATFALAMDASPESIGAALARRERANLGSVPPS